MNKNPPTARKDRGDGAVHAVGVRPAAVPVGVVRRHAAAARPKGYRFKANFPEAALLAKEADVRMAGVNVGKVRATELGPGGRTTQAEIELDSRFAPVKVDTRAILRQKSLLGETYVELSPGQPDSRDPRRRRHAEAHERPGHGRAGRGLPGLRPAHPPVLPGVAARRRASPRRASSPRTSTTRSATPRPSSRAAPTCCGRSTSRRWRCAASCATPAASSTPSRARTASCAA